MKNTLRQIGMIVAETALFIGILALCYGVIGGALVYLKIVDISEYSSSLEIEPYKAVLIDYLPLLIGSIISILVVHHLIFKRTLAFSGLDRSRIIRELMLGLGWSFLLIGLGFAILYLTGGLVIDQVDFIPRLFFGFLLFFIVQASVEEFMIRSFLLPTIAHRLNIPIAIFLTSFIFTILHGANPNVSFISLMNIFIAGILLGVLYIRYGRIWAPIGLHIGWNFFQGSFFGFEVSGLDVYSLIDSSETGHDLLTGGAFGFEGSIIASAFMIACTFWFWRGATHKFQGRYLYSPL